MLDGYKRLPLRAAGNSAALYTDTLFLEIPSTILKRLRRIAAPSPRSKTASMVRSYSHEMVHYHQLAGTRTGYVLRLLSAARYRVRFIALEMAGPAAIRLMTSARRERGPLLTFRPGRRPVVAQEIRDGLADAALQLSMWFDAAERFVISPGGFEQRLFAGEANVFGAVLGAAGRIALKLEAPDLEEILAPIEMNVDITLAADGPIWDDVVPLLSVLEAHAVVNQTAHMTDHPRLLADLVREWNRSPDYGYLIGNFLFGTFHGHDHRSWEVRGAVAMLADLVLDGWQRPGEAEVTWATPRHALHVALKAHLPWREIMDRPLNLWTAEEAKQKKATLAAAFDEQMIYGPSDHSESGRSSAESHGLAGIGAIMTQFAQIRSGALRAREIDLPAALLPAEALLYASDRIQENGVLDMLAAPFLLIGGLGYGVGIDKETYIRWGITALSEQAIHAFFTESRFAPSGLPRDEVGDYKDAIIQQAPFLAPCFD